MRYAVIGAGYIGPINTAALMACPDVEIVAVANRTEEKAQALCRSLGLSCPVYTDYLRMLDQVRPDAVVLNVYNDLHKPYFLACAARGIHILVEKPMSNTYEDCTEMQQAAVDAGIRVSVLQTQRYNSVFLTAQAYIREHAHTLGPLLSVCDQLSCNYFWPGRSPWHLDPVRSGGGIVLNYGVHQLDRIHVFLNEPTVRFTAQYLTRKPGIGTCSSYAMFGVSQSGVPYTAFCNGYSDPMVNELTLTFAGGTVRCVLCSNGETSFGTYVGSNGSQGFRAVPQIAENGPANHLMYVREFLDATAYLSGAVQTPPVSMDYASELVRLCCVGFETTT